MVIRVLVVAKARPYRESVNRALDRTEDFVTVGGCASAGEAVDVARTLRPDIVLLDAPLEEVRPALRALRELVPNCRVVAFCIPEVEAGVVGWAEAGVAGFVSSDSSLDEVVTTVRRIAQGEQPCSPKISGALIRAVGQLSAGATSETRHVMLTRREYEVIGLVERGYSNKEIAKLLGISQSTVKNHLHNVYDKLQVSGRTGALSSLGRQYRFQTSTLTVVN